MKRNEFRAAVEGLWENFRRSVCIMNVLEDIGLFVEPNSEKPGLQMLYGIQDTMTRTILKMLGIDDTSLMEDIDNFLAEKVDKFVNTEGLPEEIFVTLLYIIKEHKYMLPWNDGYEIKLKEDEAVVKHRAKSMDDDTVVTGYVWEGSDHAYIIPEKCGISYDSDTNTLTAHAVEVKTDIIRAEAHVLDDDMRRLFYGDTVRLGDEEFVMKPMDFNTIRLLSADREGKGLHFVKSDYE